MQELIVNHDLFNYPESRYQIPIHIHRKTPSYVIQYLINKIQDVRLFTINTKSDESRQNPQKLTPGIILIQAIHKRNFYTNVLIEVQHLPGKSTSLFYNIRELCHTIFSPVNRIITWGNVIHELKDFEQFSLFDISQIINPFDLQVYFTREWNTTHIHTEECLYTTRTNTAEQELDDYLICSVNTDDLDNDLCQMDSNSNSTTCICPDIIRPYKSSRDLWSIQNAIKHTFGKTLNECSHFNICSRGLDRDLCNYIDEQEKHIRTSFIQHAINNIFASSQIYFSFNNFNHQNNPLFISSQQLNTEANESCHLPSFFLLSDSHGKNFESVITTSKCKLITTAISGLQWLNVYNSDLCAQTIVRSSYMKSILASSNQIMFLIGTNSVRHTPADQIIGQVENVINSIRSDHSHLNHQKSIHIIETFPCFKLSKRYPSLESLINNINSYNEQLQILSNKLGFSCVKFPINNSHLKYDQMHIQSYYNTFFRELILEYVDTTSSISMTSQSHHRSKEAIVRRNKRRHDKMKINHNQYTVIRDIHPLWKLSELKQFLKSSSIKFARLPEVYKHQLRIQFNNDNEKQHAEQNLPPNAFGEQQYDQWCQFHHHI